MCFIGQMKTYPSSKLTPLVEPVRPSFSDTTIIFLSVQNILRRQNRCIILANKITASTVTCPMMYGVNYKHRALRSTVKGC